MPPDGRPGPVTRRSSGSTIQSLQRGLNILEFVARKGQGVTMAEVSREVGLHPSTTFHLLRTLSVSGFLQQDDTTKQYYAGSKIFHLASSALTEVQLLNHASPILSEIARGTGETSHLAVFERGEVIMVTKVEGRGPVHLVDRVGYPRPAHCTAIGKTLLACMPEAELDAFLAAVEMRAFTPKTITSVPLVKHELERVRAQGYAFDDEEYAQGIRCVAAPVRSFSGACIAALGISGPVWRVTLDKVGALTEHVRDAARRLSESVGHDASVMALGRNSSADPSRAQVKQKGAETAWHP